MKRLPLLIVLSALAAAANAPADSDTPANSNTPLISFSTPAAPATPADTESPLPDDSAPKSSWWKFWRSSDDPASDAEPAAAPDAAPAVDSAPAEPAPVEPVAALAPTEPLWTLTLRDGAVRSILPSSLSFKLDAAPNAIPFSPDLFSSLSVVIPPSSDSFSPDTPAPSLTAAFRASPSHALAVPLPKTLRARAADGEKLVLPWADVLSIADPAAAIPHAAPQTALPATVTLLSSASPETPVPNAFPIAILPLKTDRFTLQIPSWLLRSITVNPDRSATVVSVYGDVLTGTLPLRRIPGFDCAATVYFPSAAAQTPPPSALRYRLASADILVAVPVLPEDTPAAPAARRSLRAAASAAATPSPDAPLDLIPCIDPASPLRLAPALLEASADPSAPLPPAVRAYAPSARATDEILVPASTFRIGTAAPNAPRDETPPASVSLDAFYLSSTPVTVAQFAAFVADSSYRPFTASGLSWQNPGFPQTPNDPVVAVSWRDAAAYCNWLSRKASLAPAYAIPSDPSKPVAFDPASPGYRLPLEAEWELAARNLGKPVSFPWGNDPAETNLVRLANFTPVTVSSPWPFTSPVKSFPPSPLGFYDLSGNVAEWCQDAYRPDAYSAFYPTQNYAPLLNPAEPGARVLRGGSYLNTRAALRTTARAYGLEIVGIPNEIPPRPRCGFRVARNAP